MVLKKPLEIDFILQESDNYIIWISKGKEGQLSVKPQGKEKMRNAYVIGKINKKLADVMVMEMNLIQENENCKLLAERIGR